ncbi:PKD domain-containing protein [Nitrospira sp. BLG_2]|uniref:PKD domain-containing protein n=1 Tax=Nitrospira sp. BLG_2 TaxID=3397507 RepID=UPI003B9ECB59
MNHHTSPINRQMRVRDSLFLIFAFCVCLPLQTLAFKITEPTAGTDLSAGNTVTAHVDLGKDTGIVTVRYYWYGEQDEVLVEQDDSTAIGSIVAPVAMASSAEQEPAFGGPLKVPSNSIGPMRLLAVAEIPRGRLETKSVFDEVIVKVEPTAALTTIDFDTEKPLQLGRAGQSSAFGHVDSLGKIFELPVVADFADGVTRRISTQASGTSYTSSNDKVIRVMANGLLQIAGNGKTTITVTNRGKQASLDVNVTVNDEPNEPPVADAGMNKTVKAGSRVKLSGLKSRDPEGEALYYSWSQVRGSKISLLDANNSETSFLAPAVSEPRIYRFKLRVTDKMGADSLPAFVDVTVEP